MRWFPVSILLHGQDDEDYEDEEDVDDIDDDDDDNGDEGIEDNVDYDECSGSNATDELTQEDDKLITSNDCEEAALNAVTEGENRVYHVWSPSRN